LLAGNMIFSLYLKFKVIVVVVLYIACYKWNIVGHSLHITLYKWNTVGKVCTLSTTNKAEGTENTLDDRKGT
jgi:hypothetical protein